MRHGDAPIPLVKQGSSLVREALPPQPIEDMTMKTLLSALAAATLVASLAVPAGAAPNGRDRNSASSYREDGPCVVTGWTNWPLTKPIFECPDQGASHNGHRRGDS